MPSYRFEPETHFSRQGREYVIEDYLPNGDLQVRDLITKECTSRSTSELVEALFNGSLEMLGDNANFSFLQDKIAKSHVNDLSYLDDGDKRKKDAYRRLEYVKEIKKKGLAKFTPATLVPIAKEVHKRIADTQGIPSWSSLRRWYKDWAAASEDVRALVPAYKARGNGNHKYSGTCLNEFDDKDLGKAEEVADIVEKFVGKKFLKRAGPTIASLHGLIEGDIREINTRRSETNKLPIPHINSLYKYVKTLDPYEVDKARCGKRYADQRWRTNQQGPRPKRPLERVQFDHTRMDVMVIDTKTKLPLGRPWLTSLIDVRTKMIVGMYISFTPPSYLTVMQCLLHAIRPKAYVRRLYPGIEHPWPTYGLPEEVTVDNAKEFYSKDFDDACLQLKIKINYAPRKAAWYKGTKERFYRTLNDALLHELPGTTFSNVIDKKDYNPAKHAVISLDALLEAVHVWIVDIYHQKVHRGIEDIPFRRWSEMIKEWPPNLPAKGEELEILLGYKEERIISSSGIEFYSLYYNCKELGLIRRQLKAKEKAQLKYDPDNISVIYVHDKQQGKYLPVPALDQDYTEDLTMWQHLVIRNFARKEVQTHVDRDSLCRAKVYLQGIVDREMIANKKIAGSEKVARYLNIGQPNYAQLIEERWAENDGNGEIHNIDELNNQFMQDSRNTSNREGISNIGNVLATNTGIIAQEEEQRQTDSVVVEEVIDQENVNSTKRREDMHSARPNTKGKENTKTKKPSRSIESKHVSISTNSEDDSDHHELGWSADYDLPM
jgi:putative transposase